MFLLKGEPGLHDDADCAALNQIIYIYIYNIISHDTAMVIQINKMTVLEYLNVWIEIWHEWHKWKKHTPLAEKCAQQGEPQKKQRLLYQLASL